MKAKILAFLKNNMNAYISGEEISRALMVSRTAVWKYINALRKEGYEIESSPKLGYRLTSVPDILTPLEVCDGLQASIMGRRMYYFEQLESTNHEARRLAAEGAEEGAIVIADRQSAGRGRLGRDWSSPDGGIWLSLILRPQLPSYQVPLITLLTAVAAVEATKEVCGVTCGIKWPNDLLIENKKLAGILTEVSAEIDCVRYVVVGIGLNANIAKDLFPSELQESAASILTETGQYVDRSAWVRSFLVKFEDHYVRANDDGFYSVLALWRKYSVTLGSYVTVTSAGRMVSGYAVDIDPQGALLVKTDEGTERCWAGDVTLKKDGESRGE